MKKRYNKVLAMLALPMFMCIGLKAQNAEPVLQIEAVGNNCMSLTGEKIIRVANAQNVANITWQVKGDIAVVSQSATQLVIRSTEKGKGQIQARGTYRYTGKFCDDTITFDMGEYSNAVDVFKIIPCTDSIVGTEYLSVGGIYTYSIKPTLLRNLNQGIGVDIYTWTLPAGLAQVYKSEDNSSITIKVNSLPTEPLKVKIGQCADCIIEKTLGKGAEKPEIISAPFEKCISSAVTNIGFKIKTSTGHKYEWSTTNPSWVISQISGRTDTINVRIGNSGAGVITLKTIFHNDTIIQSFSIFRPLDNKNTKIEGNTCVFSNTEEIYSIYPAPNEAIVWTLPAGWTNDNYSPYSSTSITKANANAQAGYIIAKSKECPTGADTLEVKIQATPPSPITGDTCLAKNVLTTFSITPSTNAGGYLWKFPSGWDYDVSLQSSSSITATPTTSSLPGNVVVFVKGCSDIMDSAVFVIKGFTPDAATIIDRADGRTCINYMMFDTIMFFTPEKIGYTYSWSVGTGLSIISDSTANVVRVVSNAVTSAKTITVRIVSGCGLSQPYSKSNAVTGHGAIPITLSAGLELKDVAGNVIGKRIVTTPKTGTAYQWEFAGSMTNVVSSYLPFEYAWGQGVVYAYLYNSANRCWSKSNPFNTATIIPRALSAAPANYSLSSKDEGNETVTRQSNAKATENIVFSISPNPANNKIAINIANADMDATYQMQIMDMSGLLIMKQNLTANPEMIDVSSMNTGMYIVTIKSGNIQSSQKLQIVK